MSYLDPNNCRGCGNVCATGTGRVCTANGCVCDPQSAFPDECNGTCVNKSNDRTNCGLCFNHLPQAGAGLQQRRLRLPGRPDRLQRELRRHPHQPESLRDVQPRLPGGRRGVQRRHLRVRAGLHPLPAGNCVNLQTDRFNCSACGMACPGNKTCNNGSC